MAGTELRWYGVRTLFRHSSQDGPADGVVTYEERVMVWRAHSFDAAIEKAEADGDTYAVDNRCERVGLVQAFAMVDTLDEGAEVFSLMRDSPLTAPDYIDHFFDNGDERQRHLP